MKRIKTSLEWTEIRDKLRNESCHLSNYRDIKKMIDNLDFLVTQLSRLEVDARRTGNKKLIIPIIDSLNQSIEMIDEYILIATLIG